MGNCVHFVCAHVVCVRALCVCGCVYVGGWVVAWWSWARVARDLWLVSVRMSWCVHMGRAWVWRGCEGTGAWVHVSGEARLGG